MASDRNDMRSGSVKMSVKHELGLSGLCKSVSNNSSSKVDKKNRCLFVLVFVSQFCTVGSMYCKVSIL